MGRYVHSLGLLAAVGWVSGNDYGGISRVPKRTKKPDPNRRKKVKAARKQRRKQKP